MPYRETAIIGKASDLPPGGAPRYRRYLDREDPVSVTQITNISTGVTAHAYSGTITTVDPALAAAGEASFLVTNDVVKKEDRVALSVQSGPADVEHVFVTVTEVFDGSFQVTLSNLGAAQADGAMVINFVVSPAPRF